MITVVYGLGGWCENCDPSHDHPMNNIIEIQDTPDEEVSPDIIENGENI